MKLTLSDILQLEHVEARDFERPAYFITGVSTDSRSVKAGDLFIPIRGAQFDGHNFISNAVKAGAAAILAEQRWANMNAAYLRTLPVPQLIVGDATRALGDLARIYRRMFKLPILAIGGSNGKTTTKEMIRLVLGSKYSVLATEGNLNNHIGVPQTVFRLEKSHTAAVFEVGTNHPGEIDYLCNVLEPTHGLITTIGSEHLEFFGNLAGVARAELELFRWIRNNSRADRAVFINGDDRHLAGQARTFKRRVVYGLRSRTADVKASGVELDDRGRASFTVKARGISPFTVALSVPGIHNVQNALAAVAVGLRFKVPAAKIQKALASFSAPGKRMEVLAINGLTVLNDSYNSNPDSVRAALETLRAMKTSGKKIAVLADMLELGAAAPEHHRSVASYVDRAGIDCLLTFGPLSQETHEASALDLKAHYDQKNMLSEYLAELLGPGDIVLVKGSRGMKMEDVVTFLQERFSKAA